MQPKDLIAALDLIEKEKGIPKATIIQGIKEAIDRAYKREFDPEATLDIQIDESTGQIKVFKPVTVVKAEDIEDELSEVTPEQAAKIDPNAKIGDVIQKPLPIEDFSRMAVHHIKQVILQKSSEVQKDQIFDTWSGKVGTVVNGEVDVVDAEAKTVIVNLGSVQGFVPPMGTIVGETLVPGRRYDFYVQDVKRTARAFPIILSRTAPGFIAYLLKNESPEIQDGTVEIKAVARDAGVRSKLAVWSNNPHIDPIGACVGRKGARINLVSQQVNGEKIDVINWDEDQIRFIVNAMSPAQVAGVAVVEDTPTYKDATVIVPDDQLSLAIGRKGSTARLAAQLTGWNLDIKSMTQAKEEEIEYELNGNMHEPRKPRAGFPVAGSGFHRPEGNAAPQRVANRGPKQFDIGMAFDDETMDQYEQSYTKKPAKAAGEGADASYSAVDALSPATKKGDTSKEDLSDDLDNLDFDDLYKEK